MLRNEAKIRGQGLKAWFAHFKKLLAGDPSRGSITLSFGILPRYHPGCAIRPT